MYDLLHSSALKLKYPKECNIMFNRPLPQMENTCTFYLGRVYLKLALDLMAL